MPGPGDVSALVLAVGRRAVAGTSQLPALLTPHPRERPEMGPPHVDAPGSTARGPPLRPWASGPRDGRGWRRRSLVGPARLCVRGPGSLCEPGLLLMSGRQPPG